MRELLENSIISCYLKIADAIAEGSMSYKRQTRKATAAVPLGFQKTKPHLLRKIYKKKDSKARSLGKAEVLARGTEATGDAKGIAKQIPTGGNDVTQNVGRNLAKNRKGVKGARQVGRAINRAQSQEFNFQRKDAMEQERSDEIERRERSADERSEREKRRASRN